jgi:hypothetical protein
LAARLVSGRELAGFNRNTGQWFTASSNQYRQKLSKNYFFSVLGIENVYLVTLWQMFYKIRHLKLRALLVFGFRGLPSMCSLSRVCFVGDDEQNENKEGRNKMLKNVTRETILVGFFAMPLNCIRCHVKRTRRWTRTR